MESRFLLDVVIRKGSAVFKLLSGKDQTLLIRWDAFFVLDLALDIVDCVRGFDLKSDGWIVISTRHSKMDEGDEGMLTLASEGLDEDLHDLCLLNGWK